MDALKQWLSWDGNFLKVRYMPDGLTNVEKLFSDQLQGIGYLSPKSRPEWLVELSAPLGSYAGSHSVSLVEAIAAVNDELTKRHKS